MIFRTESISAGTFGAPAATIVKAAAKAMGIVFASFFSHGGPRMAQTLTLSDHDLRDIGLEQPTAGQPIAFDLLDLMPRGHRSRR